MTLDTGMQPAGSNPQPRSFMNKCTDLTLLLPSGSPFFPLAETKRNWGARGPLNAFFLGCWARWRRVESESAWGKWKLLSTKNLRSQGSTAPRTRLPYLRTVHCISLAVFSWTQHEVHDLGNMGRMAGAGSIRFRCLVKPLLLSHPVPRSLLGPYWSHSSTHIHS